MAHLNGANGSGRSPYVQSTNAQLREYFRADRDNCNDSAPWVKTPEIPTAAEMNQYLTNLEANSIEVAVPTNRISSAWLSNAEYLDAHYGLLREDAVAPLRAAIDEVRAKPNMLEKDSRENAGLYDHVYITGLTFNDQGIAAHMEFSMCRAEKKIRWEQSKRLTSGNMVALTTTDDMFRTVCIIAVVAGRPLSSLQQARPALDLYFQDAASIELDPAQEWFMVEARSAYFEAYRHTLRSLQKMAGESFPLAEHIVHVRPDVLPPAYLLSQPIRNLGPVFDYSNEPAGCNLLTNWPVTSASVLDESQTAALRRILTKRVAIVQGPPGTGKTFVAVQALKVLLKNMRPDDPPIIISAQTNHALDQLLRHVSSFEPRFVRIGSRITDHEVVEPRSLYNLRRKNKAPLPPGCARARRDRAQILTKLMRLCDPLLNNTLPLSIKQLLDYGAISQEQHDFLEHGALRTASSNSPMESVPLWLKPNNFVAAKKPLISEDADKQYEEVDQDFEQLRELEAEQVHGNDDYGTPRGETVAFAEPFTGRINSTSSLGWARRASQTRNLWKIPEQGRGAVYAHLRDKAIQNMRNRFRDLAADYDESIQDLKLGNWEKDSPILRKSRVIGVTTTGLNKYRGLLSSLSPKVIVIEEASETLEANITTACFSTTEHLILVGDHKQLRPQCACKELENEPYYLAVSLFERLVNVGIEYSQLKLQRRMAPEIRALLAPFYKNLQDHPSVLNRPDVPGMGTRKSHFFAHEGYESHDSTMSTLNKTEAKMIAGFVDYLVLNGTAIGNITVLTFYNAQRKLIVQLLKAHRNLQGQRFNVNTVDSYQGEENEVVILSLVRNKREDGSYKGIGFVGISNRICVALSRAKRGFYIFGNNYLLSKDSDMWTKVINMLKAEPRRISRKLPVVCQNHGTKTKLKQASNWEHLSGGGCTLSCEAKLPCGHPCSLRCHPFDHARVNCIERCERKLRCGHECTEPCYSEKCVCLHGHKCPATPYGIPVSEMALDGLDEFDLPTILDDFDEHSNEPTILTSDSRAQSPVRRQEVIAPEIVHRKRFVNKKGANEPGREYLGPPAMGAGLPPVMKPEYAPGPFELSLTADASDATNGNEVRPTTLASMTMHGNKGNANGFEQTLITIFDEPEEAPPTPNLSASYSGNSRRTSPLKAALSKSPLSSRPSSSGVYQHSTSAGLDKPNNTQAWRDFANGGHKAADAALEAKAWEEFELRKPLSGRSASPNRGPATDLLGLGLGVVEPVFVEERRRGERVWRREVWTHNGGRGERSLLD